MFLQYPSQTGWHTWTLLYFSWSRIGPVSRCNLAPEQLHSWPQDSFIPGPRTASFLATEQLHSRPQNSFIPGRRTASFLASEQLHSLPQNSFIPCHRTASLLVPGQLHSWPQNSFPPGPEQLHSGLLYVSSLGSHMVCGSLPRLTGHSQALCTFVKSWNLFTDWAPRPILSRSRDVCVCLFVAQSPPPLLRSAFLQPHHQTSLSRITKTPGTFMAAAVSYWSSSSFPSCSSRLLVCTCSRRGFPKLIVKPNPLKSLVFNRPC